MLFERYQQQSELWESGNPAVFAGFPRAVGSEENLLLVFLAFHGPAFSTAHRPPRFCCSQEKTLMVTLLLRTPSPRPDSSWLVPCGNSECSVPGLHSDGPGDRSRPLWSSRP